MQIPLSQDFFARDVHEVARDLLGKQLVRKRGSEAEVFTITETESYDGPEDRACHAGKTPTKRTEVMFGPAGNFYVYLIYGMYDMLNIVTGEVGYPAAVLIRGTDVHGGPGILTRELDIGRDFNMKPVSPDSSLWIADGESIPDDLVETTPRIGVDYAGEWAKKPYRFVLKHD